MSLDSTDKIFKQSTPGLSPTPFDERVWGPWHFLALWATICSSLPSLLIAIPLFTLGFTWWHLLLILFFSNVIATFVAVLIAKPGEKYGIPFVMVARSAFGIRGGKIVALFRLVLASVGVTAFTYIGSELLIMALKSWKIGFDSIYSPFPNAWNIDSQHLIAFGIMWVLSLTTAAVKVRDMRYVILVVAFLMSVFLLVAVIFATSIYGSLGPIFTATSTFKSYGSFFFAFFSALFYLAGFHFIFIWNYSDFTRVAKTHESSIIGTFIGLPLFGTIFGFFGLLLASVLYGEIQTQSTIPLTTNPYFITIFSFFFILSTIFTNWIINFIPGSFVFCSLFPRLNQRVGGLLTALLGLLLYPLSLAIYNGINLQTLVFKAGTLPSFYKSINMYGTFTSPFLGVMLIDYIFINDQSLDIEELSFPVGRYWFFKGYNWRAFLSILIGLIFQIPGLLGIFGPFEAEMNTLLTGVYGYAYIIGVLFSGILYFFVMTFSPPRYYDDDALEMTVQRHRNTFSEKNSCVTAALQQDDHPNILGI